MLSSSRSIAVSGLLMRSVAIAALIGGVMAASPMTAAVAAETDLSPVHTADARRPVSDESTSKKAETVEDRIASLHTALRITPDEEPSWNDVAKTMRDNAGRMEKLASEKAAENADGLTAVDDLKTYEKFAHAHFEGLKDLISSFETLYISMPDAQKKVADRVFKNFGHEQTPKHG